MIARDSGMPHIRVVLVLNNRVHDNYQTKTTHMFESVTIKVSTEVYS
jgi:hypothetical protein